jgi:hypothetical protein
MVLPIHYVTVDGMPAATILDNKPELNIPPFGMCSSPDNPSVIAMTAAALGRPTPAPCLPVITAPWTPGAPTVTVAGLPVLDTKSCLICAYAGQITIQTPSQSAVTVP